MPDYHGAPTIEDVADAVGVHPSTVSRALHENTRISTATRHRVRDAARRIGYQRGGRP